MESAGADGEGRSFVGRSLPERQSAHLIFNENAGGAGTQDVESLLAQLYEAGYSPVHLPTEGPEDLDEALSEGSGLVVVAGGDGTFREVAKRLQGGDRPVALVPMGTANNCARSLGIDGPPRGVLAGLRTPRKIRVDLATSRGPWGEELLVEGAGVGVFANILSAYEPGAGKSMVRALGVVANEIGDDSPIRCVVELDGERLDGEYLLLEAMNMRAIGPRLTFAPDADPSDGLLDLVLVRHENRDALFAYLRGLLTKGIADLPSVEVVRGRRLRVNWRGSAFHIDGVSHCKEARQVGTKAYSAQIEVLPGALEMWLPGKP